MTTLRSLLFMAIFYPGTLGYVLAGMAVSPLGERPLHAVVRGWGGFHQWLTRNLLGIHNRVEGELPTGQCLYAIKHQSMYETVAILQLLRDPVVVLKQELADLPLFGWMTRRFGVIPVNREAGAAALRELVARGRHSVASGRPIVIFPEGTRVAIGDEPPLKPGFAALYRAVGLPVIPVAMDSGRIWGRGMRKLPGIVTWKFGSPIPPGLTRAAVEQRVHAAINALDPPAT